MKQLAGQRRSGGLAALSCRLPHTSAVLRDKRKGGANGGSDGGENGRERRRRRQRAYCIRSVLGTVSSRLQYRKMGVRAEHISCSVQRSRTASEHFGRTRFPLRSPHPLQHLTASSIKLQCDLRAALHSCLIPRLFITFHTPLAHWSHWDSVHEDNRRRKKHTHTDSAPEIQRTDQLPPLPLTLTCINN